MLTPFSPVEKLIGESALAYERAEDLKAKGASVLTIPDEEYLGVKLRELMGRGVPLSRLKWCKYVKTNPHAYFILVLPE